MITKLELKLCGEYAPLSHQNIIHFNMASGSQGVNVPEMINRLITENKVMVKQRGALDAYALVHYHSQRQ